MTQLLPSSFLFRYNFPVKYAGGLPRRGAKLLGLAREFALPNLGSLDDRPAICEVRLVWNERGLGIGLSVRGSTRATHDGPPRAEDRQFQIWIDTRTTPNAHRASRYCHHFGLFPQGGGTTGTKPLVRQYAIARAREEAPRCDLADIQLAAQVEKSGYELEAWFPIATLHGFDPETNPRLGFYYQFTDDLLGEQFLAMAGEFPFGNDPSQWATLELVQ
ncbi:MAG: hypothetical protein HZA46_12225 [Planctomycetales bacterium]|nr:hypothetical protein [Planctomycetales bacterium]